MPVAFTQFTRFFVFESFQKPSGPSGINNAPWFPAVASAEHTLYTLWQYGLWSFQTGGTKLERFLPKNQHTQRKLLNFENWVNGEVFKIGHHFNKESDLKNDAIKKCQLKKMFS